MKNSPGNPSQEPLFMTDYKDVYHQIRNFLAGRLLGATRDEVLLEEVVKCLFCKLHLEKVNSQIDADDPVELAREYRRAFAKLRKSIPAVLGQYDELLLDPTSLAYVHQKLTSITSNFLSEDPFGDAYEIFIGNSVRGQEGQFFTPQNAVQLLVKMVDPRPGEKVIDPACGSGSFLNATARHIMAAGATPEEASLSIYGIDKDRYLADLASARLSLATLEPAQVYCADSLAWRTEEERDFLAEDYLGAFDVVLTNPPFGSRIVSTSKEVQKTFDLGYKWKYDKKKQKYIKVDQAKSSVPPQVLFVERCLSLVRPGGRLGLVVPESLVSSKNHRHVVQYLAEKARLKAVIGMPEALFKTSGKGGTHTKTCLLYFEKNDAQVTGDYQVFMAEAKWCGRDSRGRSIDRDELPAIGEMFEKFKSGRLNGYSHLGYQLDAEQISDHILAPRYYNPEIEIELSTLSDTHELVRIGDLVNAGTLSITTGDEVGKLSYGTGDIPFVRTSDISNWEVKLDPKHGLSEDVYQKLAAKQDVREGDILMVKDGTYLIGTCAFITQYDVKIVYQSHLYKLRVVDHEKLSPYLLLAALSSAPVQRQIKAKRFTQDIIDSLGTRIHELILPIPKNKENRKRIAGMVQKVIEERVEARELARRACLEIVEPTFQDGK